MQVDHILPWSRFGDNSFREQDAVHGEGKPAKRGRTPFEWFQAEKTPAEWDGFRAAGRGLQGDEAGGRSGGFYLRRNAKEVEEKFKARNLGDTRYATRVLLGMLARFIPDDGTRHVLARPGGLTAKLRRAWGLE